MSRERGAALLIAVSLTAILMVLGVSFLLIADMENTIAENEKLAAQALYFGEGVAREVKRWFDRPPDTVAGDANLSRPTVEIVERRLRLIDLDGAGPSDPVPADGSAARPYYKLGVDRDGNGRDDLFDKPYRPDLADMLVGTAAGPDVRIERSGSPLAAAFLDALAEKVLPGFPAARSGVRARIQSIDLFAPPTVDTGSATWTRLGIATVRVRVQIARNGGRPDEIVLADRTIGAVLNEIPYAAAYGPFHACGALAWDGAFKVRWGAATTTATADLPRVPGTGMSRSIPRDLPRSPRIDTLHGHAAPAGDPMWAALVAHLDGQSIDDPWFRFFAGLRVSNWSALGSPQVVAPGTDRQDESNRFQDFPAVTCPEFDYDTWKAIARSGGSDVHLYAWDDGSRFREDGVGASAELASLTDGRTGLFFFDTSDGLPPHDLDASEVAVNLTPPVTIARADYGVRGVLHVNTARWGVQGSPGRPATFTLPGEPFRDRNENGVREAGEEWINLRYSGAAGVEDSIVVDAADTYDPAAPSSAGSLPVWNARGPSLTHDAIVWGILYVAGVFDAGGTPTYNGSVVSHAGAGIGARTAGTASLFWDPTIQENWPPLDWGLPRVVVTRWDIDE